MEQQNTKKAKPQTDYKERVVKIIQSRKRRIEIRRNAGDLARKTLLIAIGIYLALAFIFGVGVVQGEAMYPRLRDGDLVLYYRLEAEQNIGDVIAYYGNNELQYGRIVALGGDTVDMNDAGQLIVNGSVQQEEIFFETNADGKAVLFPIALAENEVFVLGDNRVFAQDSRDFGPITQNNVRGKVISLLRNRRI